MSADTDPWLTAKPRVAVFGGPTATVLNSAPLLTSNQARERRGLPLLTDAWGQRLRFDQLRAQRLAKPVTVYVEQFSAHPLEADAAHLYGPPDGYLDADGDFHAEPTSLDDRAVYRIELRPEDGLLPLPYMAVQADGSAWDGDGTHDGAPPAAARQPFYPDPSRVFEEIDRLGHGENGESNMLSAHADFDFFRVLPSGGYTKGLEAARRTDVGEGDIASERLGEDYFPYRPRRRYPPREALADVTNAVSEAMASGRYQAGMWLEGSPSIEETLYWLNLLVDTDLPVVGCASTEWPHGCLGASGDRNLIHAVRYLGSRIWRDEHGRNQLGFVLVDAERVLTARDVQKADARPGGYLPTGGHGGVVASLGDPGPPVLTSVPAWRHTHRSDVRLSRLPAAVPGVRRQDGQLTTAQVRVLDEAGRLLGEAIPHVSIVKHARYLTSNDSLDEEADEVELAARIERNLAAHPLAGFVMEATAPYGSTSPAEDRLLGRAALSGMPVVRVGRGNTEGWVPHERMRLAIAGANLTSTKARMLLMACLLRFGAWPPAADPLRPTDEEEAAVEAMARRYQEVFDTH